MIDWMKIYKKTILRLFLQLKMPEYLINAPFESIYHTVQGEELVLEIRGQGFLVSPIFFGEWSLGIGFFTYSKNLKMHFNFAKSNFWYLLGYPTTAYPVLYYSTT